MRIKQNISGQKREQGIIITLVAVFMLGVIGAMAALSIDVVTIYTARSEAQLAADSAALAGARVLANSGMTSNTNGGMTSNAEAFALAVATQVAASNAVGGRLLNSGGRACTAGQEISVCFTNDTTTPPTNPHVTVTVQRTDLPTFFARIWGRTQLTVAATATAEAFNPSAASATANNPVPPVAPICVKPWLLPNIDPTSNPAAPTPIFNAANGAITNSALLGWTSTNNNATKLSTVCPAGACNTTKPVAWKYYPGNQASFPAPTTFPNCTTPLNTAYEQSIAGCVQTAIACNDNADVTVDFAPYLNRNPEATDAVNCLTHATNGGGGDKVTVYGALPPTSPFEFEAGADNPIVGVTPNDVMVSDSIVTVPVYDNGTPTLTPPPTTPLKIIGFVQLFLNPDGRATRTFGPPANRYMIPTTVINLVGCGDGTGGAAGTPILGNGASPVAVRLITPP
jgi:hypothetical protein